MKSSGLCISKSVMVTGGASGIGAHISRLLCAEGAKVTICDLNEDAGTALAAELNQNELLCEFVKCNVTQQADVLRAMKVSEQKFGRLDGLVNNAGLGLTKPFTDNTDEDFNKITSVNLYGVFLCCREFIQHTLMAKRDAVIVNMSSVGGLVGTAELALYAMTKHGVMGLTKALAIEYAKSSIRINAVCPGPTSTKMIAESARNMGYEDPNDLADLYGVPSGRLSLPEEVAEAVVWLLSDRSSNTTGASLLVDGGYVAR